MRGVHALVVGNPVLDELRRDGVHQRFAAGGTATYASLALRALGAEVTLVGAVGEAHTTLLAAPLRAAGVELTRLRVARAASTSYELDYVGDAGERRVRLLEAGPRIEPADLPTSTPAAFAHLGPVAGEVTAATARACAGLALPLGVDLHALRQFTSEGEVRLGSAAESALPFELFDTIKGSIPELRAFAQGAPGLEASMRAVAALGVRNVLATDGARGALLLCDERLTFVPAYSVTEVDATGAGDVTLAAFLFARHAVGEPAEDAATFAAAAASFVVEGTGASMLGSRADVETRRRTLCARPLDDALHQAWSR